MAKLGYDVLSVDWRIPISEARAQAPDLAMQGNLDSTLLLGPPKLPLERTRAMLQEAEPRARLHLQPRARHHPAHAAGEREGGGRRGPRLPRSPWATP